MTEQTNMLVGNASASLDLPEDLTRRLIEIVRQIDFTSLPSDVQRRARHSLTDTLGVAAFGSVADAVGALRSVILDPLADGGATVFGPGRVRANPAVAAMLNGLAGHVRDFDDAGSGGHVSAVIVPAALALAELNGASGVELLSAMVCGYEVASRVNRLLTGSHYYLGFHSTGTVGTFGATAAACHVLDLSPDEWAMAFGVAGSLASGLIANFGSMTKPLHSANAARAGVLAARLAKEGFTGSDEILEHTAGFVRTHTTDSDATAALGPLGAPWGLADMVYKFHAACSGTHSGADGIRRLVAQHRIAVDDVAHIRVCVPRIQTEVANVEWPVTVEQARFSIRFVAAAALLGIDTGARFPRLDSEIVDPRVTAAIGLIEVGALEGVDHGGAAEIEMHLKNGQVLATSLNSLVPFDDLDLEWSAVEEKFRETASTLWGPTAIDDALGRLARFEREPSVRDFVSDLTGF